MIKIWLSIFVLVSSFIFSGCSLLPRLTFNTPGTVPKSTEKSLKDVRCQGELKINQDTGEVSCTKGFYSKETDYKQIERKFTLAEMVGNFIRGLAGWSFWLIVIVLLLVPGAAGWLIGRVCNIFHSALTGTVSAISRFRKNIPTVVLDGQTVPDPTYVKAVDALLDELEIEHRTDPAILKTILDIRTQLKIADED